MNNYEFCAMPGFTTGYCCNGKNGCPSDIKEQGAILCSHNMAPHLKMFTCPIDRACGYQKKLEITDSWGRIFTDSARSKTTRG